MKLFEVMEGSWQKDNVKITRVLAESSEDVSKAYPDATEVRLIGDTKANDNMKLVMLKHEHKDKKDGSKSSGVLDSSIY